MIVITQKVSNIKIHFHICAPKEVSKIGPKQQNHKKIPHLFVEDPQGVRLTNKWNAHFHPLFNFIHKCILPPHTQFWRSIPCPNVKTIFFFDPKCIFTQANKIESEIHKIESETH